MSPKYVVNAGVGEFISGEVVELNPALFADLIEGKYLSPIDDHGTRLNADGEPLVLHSTQYEQSQPAPEWGGGVVQNATLDPETGAVEMQADAHPTPASDTEPPPG